MKEQEKNKAKVAIRKARSLNFSNNKERKKRECIKVWMDKNNISFKDLAQIMDRTESTIYTQFYSNRVLNWVNLLYFTLNLK